MSNTEDVTFSLKCIMDQGNFVVILARSLMVDVIIGMSEVRKRFTHDMGNRF